MSAALTADFPAFPERAPAATPPAQGWHAPAGWTPAPPRRSAALGVLALHALALVVVWQAGRHVVKHLEPRALSVSLLPAAPLQPPAPRPSPAPADTPTVAVVPTAVVPVPEFTAVAPFREASAPPQSPAAQPSPEAAPARAAPAPAPPAPKPVAAGSLRYRVEPAVEVPRLSRRAGESGRVVLRVVFDTDGRPRDIQLQRSSGFARLDAQAREAMQAARIVPVMEDGRAIEVVASATLEYETD